MALASVVSNDCGHFSVNNFQPFAFPSEPELADAGFDVTPRDILGFSVNNQQCPSSEDGVERKIEFLHGTTTLAFKVSLRVPRGSQPPEPQVRMWLTRLPPAWIDLLLLLRVLQVS